MAISCMDNSGTGGLGAHSVFNGTAKRKEKKKKRANLCFFTESPAARLVGFAPGLALWLTKDNRSTLMLCP